jgi:hypothetical protein
MNEEMRRLMREHSPATAAMIAAHQALAPAGWIVESASPNGDYTMNRDGISWSDAPAPPRKHECRPQSSGSIGRGVIARCACGAMRFNGSAWRDRNRRCAAATENTMTTGEIRSWRTAIRYVRHGDDPDKRRRMRELMITAAFPLGWVVRLATRKPS